MNCVLFEVKKQTAIIVYLILVSPVFKKLPSGIKATSARNNKSRLFYVFAGLSRLSDMFKELMQLMLQII